MTSAKLCFLEYPVSASGSTVPNLWYQGLVSGKTVFPWTECGLEEWFRQYQTDGERQGASLLTSCGAAQFLTGHTSVPGLGTPALSERMVIVSAVDADRERNMKRCGG